jgi:VanZ family protein
MWRSDCEDRYAPVDEGDGDARPVSKGRTEAATLEFRVGRGVSGLIDGAMADSNALMRAGESVAPEPSANLRQLAAYWGVVLAWMGVISLMSTEPFSASNTHRYLDPLLRYFFPHLSAAGFTLAHSVIRKTAHFNEFFVLGCLTYWACRRGRAPRWRSAWAWQALGLALVYALLDEAHQAFVPNRTSSLVDSGIDTFGAASSQGVVYLRCLIARARRLG